MKAFIALLTLLSASFSFAQVTFSPQDNASTNTQQIKVSFPQAMLATSDAFSVNCKPEVAGDGYWADNNTTWVYNFNLPKTTYGDPRPLAGGTTCSVEQTATLTSVTDQVFANGTLKHQFSVEGPVIDRILTLSSSSNTIRETDPVVMVIFNGDIERSSLYSGSSFIYYLDQTVAPSERMALKPVPTAQSDELYALFEDRYGYIFNANMVEKENSRWALVTVDRKLVPGTEVGLYISAVQSAYNTQITAKPKNVKLFTRPTFNVTVDCLRRNTDGEQSPYCQPESSPSVSFNEQVLWKNAKNVKIEYVPQGSETGQTEVAYPKSENVVTSWIGWALSQVNISLDDNDALVKGLDFSHVKVAPNTQVTVTFPSNLTDVDGRPLDRTEFVLDFGNYQESIQLASGFRVMERLVNGNKSFPFVVMNLNQTLTIKTSGAKGLQPIIEVSKMIDLLASNQKVQWGRPLEELGSNSPLDLAGITSSSEQTTLQGDKNQKQLFQVPFAQGPQGIKSGLYGIEVTSDLMGDQSPRVALTMVTDLAVHMKKGKSTTLAWVTSFSSGNVVAGANISVYGCDKAVKVSGQTDQNGIFAFENSVLPNCGNSGDYLSGEKFFVAATKANDITLTASDQVINESYALSAPGVDYFYSDINEGEVYYHAIIGVNLVKPGQQVPVKLVATVPSAEGFVAPQANTLPQSVEVRFSQNSKITYKFDLTWSNGTAEFKWKVPKSAELGSYNIVYTPEGQSWGRTIGNSDIEVSEFKIPLMSAQLNTPDGKQVQPTELKVSGSVQYANGVGAKELPVSFSYYFANGQLERGEDYQKFNYANGKYTPEEQEAAEELGLPNVQTVAQIDELTTNKEGTVSVDIASQLTGNNETVAETLAKAKRPYQLIVRMKYQDQMGEFQTLSGATNVYNASSYVGAGVTSGPKQDARLQAVNLGVDGKAYTNPSDLDVKVFEIKANVIGEELFGGFIKNVISKEVVDTNWTANCSVSKTSTYDCQVGDLDFGSYVFQVTSKTTGQIAHTKFTVDRQGQVDGEFGGYWNEEDPDLNLQLASDKETYKGGEMAQLSFESPFDQCSALITLERGEIVDHFVDNQACANGQVSVPVESTQAPNVFASVYLVTGRKGEVSVDQMDLGKPTYRLGFSNLKVDWDLYKAEVSVATDKKEYQPGETASVTIDVASVEGDMINPQATLVVIEEKILEMKENKTLDLLTAMMGLRGHSVQTMNIFNSLESSALQEGKMLAEALADEAKAGETGGDGSDMETFKRKLFDALVTWQTDIPVINGQAQATFKLNDSLTKFKVFAVVRDANAKFGTGETTYLSAQDLQSYPNMPPVTRTGDQFPVTVTLQNNSKDADSFTVSVKYQMFDSNGKVVDSGLLTSMQTIDGASSKPVQVGDLSVNDSASRIEYVVEVRNSKGDLVDSLEPEAQKVTPAIPLSVQDEFMVQLEGDSQSFTFQKNPKALAGKGEINVQVSSSLVENTRVKVVQDALANPFSGLTVEGRLLTALVTGNGLQDMFTELVSQLDDNGFIKYYPSAPRGSFWMTTEMVSLIGAFGQIDLMPASMKSNMEAGMEKALSGQLGTDYLPENEMVVLYSKVKALNAMAELSQAKFESYSVEVTAGIQNLEYRNWPVSALMEMALVLSKTTPDQVMTSPLLTYTKDALIVLNNKTAKLDDASTYSWWGYSDETIGAAKLVKAMSVNAKATGASSQDNYLDNLVAGLVNANKQGTWYTLRTKAWVLAGLQEFANTYESQPVSGQTVVATSESSLQSTTVWSQGKTSGGMTSQWPSEQATVTVTHSGNGQPWTSVTASAAVKLEAPNYKGLKVEKTIENVTSGAASFNAGDLIKVTLKITANGANQHVALFDPIPGGANILSDGWGPFSLAQKSYEGYKVYFSHLPSGTTEINYQYQLNNPGTFNLPPTRAEGLYEPGYFGEIPNATMTVVQ